MRRAAALLACMALVSTVGPAMSAESTTPGVGAIVAIDDVKSALREFNQGNADGAIALFTNVLATHSLSGKPLAVVHYDRGMAYLSKKDTADAIADFSAAIEEQPHYAAPIFPQGIRPRGSEHSNPQSKPIPTARRRTPILPMRIISKDRTIWR